jgi:UDP-glucose 4-epimerase
VIVYDNLARGRRENLHEALKDPRVKWFEAGGDIQQSDILEAACEGADGVFHFAALWLLQCHEFPQAAFDVNVRGTFNVLEACRKKKVKRLVYSSSASVYGDAVTEPMGEDHPFNNRTFYGATKIAGEAMLTAYAHRYGLQAVGLRYMNVYGPRQDYKGAYVAVIMRMLDNIENGKPPVVYGDGSQAYDFVYVRDCARANVCAMEAENVSDEFFNVGTGVRTSIKQVAELILKLTESKLELQYEPTGLTFVKNRIGDPKRAKERIGFEARTPLIDGMRELIAWRRTHEAEVRARRDAK